MYTIFHLTNILLFYIECTFFIYFMHKFSTRLMFLFWINVFISPRQSIAFINIIINVLVSFIFLNICIFLTFYSLIESFHFYCRNACNFILFLIIFKISLPSLVCFASFKIFDRDLFIHLQYLNKEKVYALTRL